MIRKIDFSYSKVQNIKFGVMNLLDGIVRILSLGFLQSSFALEYAKSVARKRILGEME